MRSRASAFGRTLFDDIRLLNAQLVALQRQTRVNISGVITSRNPGDLEAFSAKIIEEVKEGRHAQRSAA